MNRIKSLKLLLMAVMAILSCTRPEYVSTMEQPKVLKVSMPGGFTTKVSMGQVEGSTVSQVWNAGDLIAVVEGRGTAFAKSSVYRLVGEGGTRIAEFEHVSGNANLNGGVDIVYPVSAAAAEGIMPHSQTYVPGGYDPESVVLSWHSDDGVDSETPVTLVNESSVLCLQYTGAAGQKIEHVRVKMKLSDGRYDTFVVSSQEGVSLSSDPVSFYVSVPEVAAVGEVIFETVLTDQSVMRIVSENKTFDPGIIYRFPPKEFVANVQAEEGYDVYLCIGQSNMSGRGEILAEDAGVKEGVFLLDGDGKPVPAEIPFNIYSTVRKKESMQRFGLHNVFAEEIYKFTGRKVLLVVNARGETSIVSWLNGAERIVRSSSYADDENSWGQELPELYDEAVRRAKQAMQYGELKGILWHQGGGDSNSSAASQYVERFTTLATDLRNDLASGEGVPIVIGHSSTFFPKAAIINPQLTKAAEAVPNAYCASSVGCATQSDNTHFTRAGYIVMGKRYAEFILDKVYGIKAQ